MKRALVALLALTSALASAKPPRLALVISIDGMGTELFTRMRPRFKSGLAQLANGGAYFPYARYSFAKTSTAPGHTTLMTGADPWRHGVATNRIFDRASGKPEPVLFDPDHPLLEAPPSVEDVSPDRIHAETLADRLRLATYGRGKVVAISVKGRAAIAMAGRLGQAWWFNGPTGKFVTGTYYSKEFPAWVKAFNEKKIPDSYFGKQWELAQPAKEYAGDDDRPAETDLYALGRTFPHPLTGGLPGLGAEFEAALSRTPMMSDVLVQLAKAAIDGEQLGKDEVPDLLCVSFSGIDLLEHLYGPYSWEVQDAMIRIDRTIGDLLGAAEKAAGSKANLTVVLSADHGSPALPEEWASAGLPAARLNPQTLGADLAKELKARFGADLVLGIDEDGTDVYLNRRAIAERKLDLATVRRAAADFLQRQPAIALAVTPDELSGDGRGGYLEALRRGYFPDVSGDVLFLVKPFQIVDSYPSGTNHGTPYSYDATVPVIFFGHGVKAGTYVQQIDPIDVAPTAAALLEMLPPAQAEGSPRPEAISVARGAAGAGPGGALAAAGAR